MALTPENQARSIDPARVSEWLMLYDLGEADRRTVAAELYDMVFDHVRDLPELDQARLSTFIDRLLTGIADGSTTVQTVQRAIVTCMFRAWRGADVLRTYINEFGRTG
ncbi:hypothetical protein PQU92_02760 [Asticcacaulis sp. BYS171W]|uniref:Uncharacterized protein n=1 Tax=Asticcacaulis aquaticus TaxID=2984212 RepID=A0ABT5HQC0_9CAUL|nr:hypothetical protein [Asticcacaulis aquaticus]MDC7682179.1 hypothetical protein [Asticcacaulis aquaticus]